jgi:hypothetical protein
MRDAETLKDLILDVLEDVPGCTDPSAELAIKRSARDFLQRSKIWTKKIEIDLVADQESYTIAHNENANIERILAVKIKPESSTSAWSKIAVSDEDLYEFIEPDILNFVDADYAPSYALTDGMEVEVALRPTMNNADIPGWIVDRYGDGIAAGAKANLQAKPGKPWSNPQGVIDNNYLFNEALTKALNEKRREGKNEVRGISA